jgi:hypothetical protein
VFAVVDLVLDISGARVGGFGCLVVGPCGGIGSAVAIQGQLRWRWVKSEYELVWHIRLTNSA